MRRGVLRALYSQSLSRFFDPFPLLFHEFLGPPHRYTKRDGHPTGAVAFDANAQIFCVSLFREGDVVIHAAFLSHYFFPIMIDIFSYLPSPLSLLGNKVESHL